MNRLVLLTTVLVLTGCGQRVPLKTPRTPANYSQLLTLTADRTTVHPGETVLLRHAGSSSAAQHDLRCQLRR